MSKSKKNTKNNSASNSKNSAQNCENNMSYATDKQSNKTTDCHDNGAQNKSESNCR